MEELKLDVIMVASYPGSIFKFHLIYEEGNATGMRGVCSYDEDWYYLYKKDAERYRVKRRKDLEGKEPSITYKQVRKKPVRETDIQRSLNSKKEKIAESEGGLVMESINTNDEIQKFFGDRFIATATMSRFDVMIDHFSKKFSISTEQASEAYEKTLKLHEEGKIERFTGYFAASGGMNLKDSYRKEE